MRDPAPTQATQRDTEKSRDIDFLKFHNRVCVCLDFVVDDRTESSEKTNLLAVLIPRIFYSRDRDLTLKFEATDASAWLLSDSICLSLYVFTTTQ